MNALHNRLISTFEGFTQRGRLEDYCRADLEEFSELLKEWSSAMEASLAGDTVKTKEHLEKAFKLAMEADKRKDPPPAHGGPVVRYGDLL